jgi:hypothetical protein
MDDDIMPVSKADAEKRKKNKRKTPDVIAEPEDNVQPEAPTSAVKMEEDASRPDEAATDNTTKPEEEDTDKGADRDYELYIERLKKLHEAHSLTPPRVRHT